MTLRRLLIAGSTWAVAAFAATLLAVVVAAPIVHGRGLVVLSGSMRPTLDVGDVTVNESIPARAARPGDILTFSDPARPGRLLTHRAQLVERAGGRMRILTRGDANSGSEEWRIAPGGRVGRVVFRVPRLGYALHALGSPLGNLGFIVLPALALAAFALRRIWTRPGAPPEPAPVELQPASPVPIPARTAVVHPSHPYLAGRNLGHAIVAD